MARVVRKGMLHLASNGQLLFKCKFTVDIASKLEANLELAEQIETFIGRFERLQYTLGDKLSPLFLATLGEKKSNVIDNLDRTERLKLLHSVDECITISNLSNQMIHEYVEELLVLISALKNKHTFVPALNHTAYSMAAAIARLGKLEAH